MDARKGGDVFLFGFSTHHSSHAKENTKKKTIFLQNIKSCEHCLDGEQFIYRRTKKKEGTFFFSKPPLTNRPPPSNGSLGRGETFFSKNKTLTHVTLGGNNSLPEAHDQHETKGGYVFLAQDKHIFRDDDTQGRGETFFPKNKTLASIAQTFVTS